MTNEGGLGMGLDGQTGAVRDSFLLFENIGCIGRRGREEGEGGRGSV